MIPPTPELTAATRFGLRSVVSLLEDAVGKEGAADVAPLLVDGMPLVRLFLEAFALDAALTTDGDSATREWVGSGILYAELEETVARLHRIVETRFGMPAEAHFVSWLGWADDGP